MAAKKITLKIGDNTYTLQAGVKFLNKIGILPKKTEENVDRLGDILLGLKVQDPFILATIAEAGLAHEEGLTSEAITEAVFEAGVTDKVFSEYDAFLTSSPLGLMKKNLEKELEAVFLPNEDKTEE